MQKPYYQDSAVTIYHGDCRDIVPQLDPVDLVLTDPPYGINQGGGMGSGGMGLGNKPRNPRKYENKEWDKQRPAKEVFELILSCCKNIAIWGGNYFADLLPVNGKWLVWNKLQTMPTYSDCELCWTSFDGNSVKMFTYCGNGLQAKEKARFHPTQKPVALIKWAILLCPGMLDITETPKTILDPFMGSGTTLRAAKDMNKKAIGIEIEEKYCEIAALRMSQEVLQFESQEPASMPEENGLKKNTMESLQTAGNT